MSGHVVVAVRVRPLNAREIHKNAKCVVRMEQNQTVLQAPTGKDKNGRQAKDGTSKTFKFDHSYDSSDPSSETYARQSTIYQDLGEELLRKAFDGYNCCIFAYGQTGSGKSFSMMGSRDDPGIIPLICDELFLRIAKSKDPDTTCRVECSYLEIYNERVRDLLSPSSPKNLRVREHPSTGPYVEDLSKLLISSFEEIKYLMDQGNKTRTVASTSMNETSSRSHAVFVITLTQKTMVADLSTEKVSKISLVDLAGSERVHSTGAVGLRLKEGAEINKSLSTLGRVISILADKQNRRSSTSQITVPYRDSVLTWLLKDSLGGNSMTAMIATISPADINYEETLSTLRYADSAKKIKNHAVVNEDQNMKMIRELKEELALLRAKMLNLPEEASTPLEEQTVSIVGNDGAITLVSKSDIVDRLEQSSKLMADMNQSWEQKLANTQRIQREREEALEELGIRVEKGQIGVSTPKKMPHLINLSEDALLSECLIYNLKPGLTICGSLDSPSAEIKLSGGSIQPEHCIFSNISGVVSVEARPGASVMINGMQLINIRRLKSGDRVILGDEASQVFRFNHPEEVRAERSLLEAASPSTPPSQRKRMYLSPSSLEGSPRRPESGASIVKDVRKSDVDSDYFRARREAAIMLGQDNTNLESLDDGEIDKLFDDLRRVKLSRRTTSTSSPVPPSEDIPDTDSALGHKQSSASSLNPADDAREDQLESYPMSSPRIQDLSKRSSIDQEMTDAQRKRASDSERLVQILNAARLEAEAKGQVKHSSVIERLAAAKMEAEQALAQEKQDMASFKKEQSSGIFNATSAALCSKVLSTWRRLGSVSMVRDGLLFGGLLKEAQVIAVKFDSPLRFQFTIMNPGRPSISPNEEDLVFEAYDKSLTSLKRPVLVVQIMHTSRNVIYHWSITKLAQKVERMRSQMTSPEAARLTKIHLQEKPFPKYSLLGQARMPLVPCESNAKKFVKLDVFSVHTFLHSATLQINITVAQASRTMYDIELQVVSISGLPEKEATEIHIHSFFQRKPTQSLTTKTVSGFGDGTVIFNNRYACQLHFDDMPDTMHFQIFGLAQSPFLDKLISWDDLQEPQHNLSHTSHSQDSDLLLCKIAMAELDSTGSYTDVDVLSSGSTDPGFYYIHQGLSRRFNVSIVNYARRDMTYNIEAVSILKVSLVNVKLQTIQTARPEEAVSLKIISGGQITGNKIEGVIVQWDSSVHNTMLLDRTTSAEQFVVLDLQIHLSARTIVPTISLAAPIHVRVHGRDQQQGWISRLFSGHKNLTKVWKLFEIHLAKPQDHDDNLNQFDTSQRSFDGQEALGQWRPRGISLVDSFLKMNEAQRLVNDNLSTRLRYTEEQLNAKSGHQATIRFGPPLERMICLHWLQLARLGRKGDLAARVSASFHGSAASPFIIAETQITSNVARSSHLAVPATAIGKWDKHYFSIRAPYLIEYADSQQLFPTSIVDLTRFEEIVPVESLGRAFVFKICGRGGEFCYQASSLESFEAWMSVIGGLISGKRQARA